MTIKEKCVIVRYSRKKKADVLSRKEEIMNTVLFAYNVNRERRSEVLWSVSLQDSSFMCSYKIRQRQKTVCDIDVCQ